jgi:ABC-type Fe3+-siderophore transport system permease subunit
VVWSGGGTYPPLLKFLAIVAFLGFAAACVLAYARDSVAPFTITSIVLAGLFLISVLPVVIPAIWAGEGPRRAAQTILYVMIGGQPVSYEEITARPTETAGLPPLADERKAGSTIASPRE